jgi:hypothetical protein
MGDTRGFMKNAARTSGNLALRFTLRFLLWTALIGVLASFVGEALWPHVYALYGPPLGIAEKACYQAVLFGDAVASIMGGFSVALVGTVFKR